MGSDDRDRPSTNRQVHHDGDSPDPIGPQVAHGHEPRRLNRQFGAHQDGYPPRAALRLLPAFELADTWAQGSNPSR